MVELTKKELLVVEGGCNNYCRNYGDCGGCGTCNKCCNYGGRNRGGYCKTSYEQFSNVSFCLSMEIKKSNYCKKEYCSSF